MRAFPIAACRHTWPATLGAFDSSNRIGVQTRYDIIDPVGLYLTTERRILSTISASRVRESSVAAYFENTINWTDRVRGGPPLTSRRAKACPPSR